MVVSLIPFNPLVTTDIKWPHVDYYGQLKVKLNSIITGYYTIVLTYHAYIVSFFLFVTKHYLFMKELSSHEFQHAKHFSKHVQVENIGIYY